MHQHGGKNPAIFTGAFPALVSKEAMDLAQKGQEFETERCGGVKLVLHKKTRRTLIAVGYLPHVSEYFFNKLIQLGWRIDREAANLYGFPSRLKDKLLHVQLKQYRKQVKEALKRLPK